MSQVIRDKITRALCGMFTRPQRDDETISGPDDDLLIENGNFLLLDDSISRLILG